MTASVDDVDERVVSVLERLARFVGADSAVLAARSSELEDGMARARLVRARARDAGLGHRRGLGARDRGVDRLGHALVAHGEPPGSP